MNQRCFRDLGRLRLLTLQCRQFTPLVVVSLCFFLVPILWRLSPTRSVMSGVANIDAARHGLVSSIPLFWVDTDSGWPQVCWRCNDACLGDVAEEVKLSDEQMRSPGRRHPGVACQSFAQLSSSSYFGGASAASGAGGDRGYRQSWRRTRPKALALLMGS